MLRDEVVVQPQPAQHESQQQLEQLATQEHDIQFLECSKRDYGAFATQDVCSLSSSDDEAVLNFASQDNLKNFLQQWALTHQIPHLALSALLVFLNANGHPELPTTARTLLSTPRNLTSEIMSGMEVVQFGLRRGLDAQLSKYPETMIQKLDTLEISLNIDGLPLFKSSKLTLWPVLCALHLNPLRVFPVTLTAGPSKPTDLKFLTETVTEVEDLLKNGICGLKVVLRSVVCDAPAKAMVKGTKLCSGYNGCDKCTQKGTWVDGRVTYPAIQDVILRTNDTFRTEMASREMEGQAVSPFLQLPIDMIKQFPIDYMHQACLGVMRKLIVEWVRGQRKNRMSAGQIKEVSQRLATLRQVIPDCFARKPRSLEEIDRWKATELRQFALYTGKQVLKGILDKQLYNHFLVFSVALCILVSPKLANDYSSYAKSLMEHFVSKFPELYGSHFMVYNVHAMIHLSDEAESFGCLDACSAFPFESYLGKLKRLIRSGNQPLKQVANRLSELEQSHGITYPTASQNLKKRNRAFIIPGNKCCEAIERKNNDIVCRVFEKTEPLFTEPCDSRIIASFRVKKRDSIIKLVPECDLVHQAILIEERQSNIFMAVLHEL